MPGFYRQRHKFGRQGNSLMGAIWMIGLGVLFFTGDWWPGILVLVGLTMILEALIKDSPRQVFDEPEAAAPPAEPFQAAPPSQPEPAQPPAAVETNYRTDLLPANCAQCGGPIRIHEVKWLSSKTAACPYCDSTLTMKKS